MTLSILRDFDADQKENSQLSLRTLNQKVATNHQVEYLVYFKGEIFRLWNFYRDSRGINRNARKEKERNERKKKGMKKKEGLKKILVQLSVDQA